MNESLAPLDLRDAYLNGGRVAVQLDYATFCCVVNGVAHGHDGLRFTARVVCDVIAPRMPRAENPGEKAVFGGRWFQLVRSTLDTDHSPRFFLGGQVVPGMLRQTLTLDFVECAP